MPPPRGARLLSRPPALNLNFTASVYAKEIGGGPWTPPEGSVSSSSSVGDEDENYDENNSNDSNDSNDGREEGPNQAEVVEERGEEEAEQKWILAPVTVAAASDSQSLLLPDTAADRLGTGAIGMARGPSIRKVPEKPALPPLVILPEVQGQRRPDYGLRSPTGFTDDFGTSFI